MAIVKGVVERKNDNYGKVNICVNGSWYSTKPEWIKAEPNQGDQVEFDDGGRNYIKNIRITGGTAGSAAGAAKSNSQARQTTPQRTFPVHPTAPERTINRQNALTAAVNMYVGTLGQEHGDDFTFSIKAVSADDFIIELARKFEAYTTGDLDMEEAKKALEQPTVGG